MKQSEWWPLYEAEKSAYFALREQEAPPNGEHIRPTQVHMAKDAWYTALAARYDMEDLLAEEFGIKRWQVPPLMLTRVMQLKKEVKEAWRSSQSR